MDGMFLYKLEPIVDNPKYEGFAFVNNQSVRGTQRRLVYDFGTDNIKSQGRAWTVPPLAPFWIPQQVTGRVHAFNDYPCVNLTIPAFSRRAVDALNDLLKNNGELLPLISDVGEYYAYNITTVADILDHSNSIIIWPNESHVTAIEIERYVCLPDRMKGLSIFHIVEKPTSVFVTEEVVERIRSYNLQGFRFIKLWPLPEGISWQDADKKLRKQHSIVNSIRGDIHAKRHTVVLMFPIRKLKPSKSEKDRFEKIMSDIDVLLFDSKESKDMPLVGSLVGEDVLNSELRLFITCPDSDTLVNRLAPWLKSLNWPGGLRVLKRFGEMSDPNCKEEYVEIS